MLLDKLPVTLHGTPLSFARFPGGKGLWLQSLACVGRRASAGQAKGLSAGRVVDWRIYTAVPEYIHLGEVRSKLLLRSIPGLGFIYGLPWGAGPHEWGPAKSQVSYLIANVFLVYGY
jgi:hypothetical protein